MSLLEAKRQNKNNINELRYKAESLFKKFIDKNNNDIQLSLIGSGGQSVILKVVEDGGDGNFGITIDGLQTYADDAAAGTAGLTTNTLYKTATAELRIKV